MTLKRWNKFIKVPYYLPIPLVSISFQPYGHVSERQNLYISVVHGGKTGYVKEMSTIFEDFQLLKPTWLTAPPRLYNQVYGDFKRKLTEKLEEISRKETVTPEQEKKTELLLIKEFSSLFGGRTIYLVTGSAPTSNHVKQFLKKCFG